MYGEESLEYNYNPDTNTNVAFALSEQVLYPEDRVTAYKARTLVDNYLNDLLTQYRRTRYPDPHTRKSSRNR
jgi:hypothetical protein